MLEKSQTTQNIINCNHISRMIQNEKMQGQNIVSEKIEVLSPKKFKVTNFN